MRGLGERAQRLLGYALCFGELSEQCSILGRFGGVLILGDLRTRDGSVEMVSPRVAVCCGEQ